MGDRVQVLLRDTATPGGPRGMHRATICLSLPIKVRQAYSHLSAQALTIAPTRSKAVVVLGAVIGWGQPSVLQLPQSMDVQPQSLLLNWLSLLGPVLQERHGMCMYRRSAWRVQWDLSL